MKPLNSVTEEFLRSLKKDDLVDVRTKQFTWTGPHKLLVYKLDPPIKEQKPAAYMEIDLDGKKLERWLIVDDQQVIRKHIPEEQSRITSRQREILKLLAEGKTSKDIAGTLGMTIKTVDTHRSNIMNRLNCHSLAELVRYALRNQIINP